MTDSPSAILLTREQSTGSNVNLWGSYLITTQRMTEQAMKGFQTLAVTGDATIPWTNYTTGNIGQCARLQLTGTLAAPAALTFPGNFNFLSIDNQTGQTVTVKCFAGTGVAIPTATQAALFCNGTDYFNGAPLLFPTGNAVFAGQLKGVLAGTATTDAVNLTQMSVAIAASVPAGTAGTLLNSITDTTRGFLSGKITLSLSGLTTTQIAGLSSLQISTKNVGGNEKLKISAGQGYVGGFLNGGTQSAQFTPVVGTEYVNDFTASSWTVNLSGMTTPQVGQRIKMNCFGNFPPFLLGTVNGQTNLYLDPGFSGELSYSSAAWGWN